MQIGNKEDQDLPPKSENVTEKQGIPKKKKMPPGLFMDRPPPPPPKINDALLKNQSLSAGSLLEVPIHILKERQRNEFIL